MSDRETLAGRRIVVTRRPEQAGRLVGLLQDRGAEVLEVPATAIGPPDDPGPLDRLDVVYVLQAHHAGADYGVVDLRAHFSVHSPLRESLDTTGGAPEADPRERRGQREEAPGEA